MPIRLTRSPGWPQPRILSTSSTALALSRDLGLSYKAAFVLLHKLREAMAAELRSRVIGGNGKVAEVDSGYFGGY
jgi:molybdenum-dependent DNA-binding transcriptional regulator ModE